MNAPVFTGAFQKLNSQIPTGAYLRSIISRWRTTWRNARTTSPIRFTGKFSHVAWNSSRRWLRSLSVPWRFSFKSCTRVRWVQLTFFFCLECLSPDIWAKIEFLPRPSTFAWRRAGEKQRHLKIFRDLLSAPLSRPREQLKTVFFHSFLRFAWNLREVSLYVLLFSAIRCA